MATDRRVGLRRCRDVFRLLGLSYVRRRPLRALLTVVTIAASVAVPGSLLISLSSYRTSVARASAQFANVAPLRLDSVHANGGISSALVDRLSSVEGVSDVIPMVQAVTMLQPSHGKPSYVIAAGVDCRIEALVGTFGCSKQMLTRANSSAPPFVSHRLASQAGRAGVLLTDGPPISLADAPKLRGLDALLGGRVVAFPLTQAQELFDRPGLVDVVYVRPAKGTDVAVLHRRLSATVGDAGIVHNSGALPPESNQALRAVPSLVLVAVIAFVVGALMVFSLMRLAYEDRRHTYATAWSVGCRPKLLVGVTVIEAALLGAVGGALGLGASVIVARPVVGSLTDLTKVILGLEVVEHVSLLPVLATIGMGVVVSVAAALVCSRWIGRDFLPSLLPGRTGGDRQPHRTSVVTTGSFFGVGIVGLVSAALAARGGGIEPWQKTVGTVGLVLAIVGFVGCGALLVPPALELVRRQLVGRPSLLAMATVDAARNSRRAIAISLTVTSAVMLATLLGAVGVAVREASTSFVQQYQANRVMVSKFEPATPDFSGVVDARYGTDVAQQLEKLPTVGAVDRMYFTYVRTPNVDVAVLADSGNVPSYPVADGTLPNGVVPRGEAILGTALARVRGLHAGDTIELPTSNGPRRLHVAAVWQEDSAVGNSIMVNTDDFAAFWGEQAPITLAVRPAHGVGLGELAASLRSKLGPAAVVLTPAGYVTQVRHEMSGIVGPFWRLEQTLLFVVVLATFVLLLLSGLQRIRQQAVLQSLGMRPANLVAVSCLSATLVAAISAMFGAAVGFAATQAARWNGLFIVGTVPPFRAPDASILVAVLLAVAAVAAGSIIPSIVTVRTDVATNLRYE